MRYGGRRSRWIVQEAVLLIAALASNAARAEDHFLAIGGGYDASSNPASLEADIAYASKAIAGVTGDQSLEIYFADGDNAGRDVQFEDSAAERDAPGVVRVLAELLGDPRGVGLRYRDHDLPHVAGPADFDVLERRFQELARARERRSAVHHRSWPRRRGLRPIRGRGGGRGWSREGRRRRRTGERTGRH